MNITAQHDLKTYVTECARLLYWAYFKPITLNYWLRNIHSDLRETTNPFSLRQHFDEYPRLKRYAIQSWWLSFFTPLISTLVVGSLYTFFASESFQWSRSGLFLLGWWIGLLFSRSDRPALRKWIVWFLFISTISIFLYGVFPEQISAVLLQLPFGIGPLFLEFAFSLQTAWLLAVGVAGGVAFGVAGGVAFGVALGVAVGVAFGVALLGVALGVAFGVALGVAYILGVFRFYFWLPELVYALFLGVVTSHGDGAEGRWLRRLPPYFDQLIILPLPFQAEIIAKAYRDNPAAARSTINYLTVYTNQQKVAANAMSGIVIDTLDRVVTSSDIAIIADDLVWIPTPAPEAIGSTLPQFLEISQSVRAIQDISSPYRKLEMLALPLRRLEQLRESLALGIDGQVGVNDYGTIVERWLRILQAAKRTLEEQARESIEIPQVYIAGPAIDPEVSYSRFKGRSDLFREIETLSLMVQPPVLLLYGGRRTGKTSALRQLPKRLPSGLIPLYVDGQGLAMSTTLIGVAKNMADQMIESARLGRNIRLSFPDQRNLESDPFPTLQSWLREIERKLPGKRFLLCLDEFERLEEVIEKTDSKAPLNFLRHMLQHQRSWSVLFAGAHTLDEMALYWSDYLINTRSLRISYLREQEARELIVRPLENFPEIYKPDAVDSIIELTRCQPYLIQLLCYTLVEELNLRRDSVVTSNHVLECVPKALETGVQYFRELWNLSLGENDRQYLERLIKKHEVSGSDQMTQRYLINKEVLESSNGDIRFQIPLVKMYIESIIFSQGNCI